MTDRPLLDAKIRALASCFDDLSRELDEALHELNNARALIGFYGVSRLGPDDGPYSDYARRAAEALPPDFGQARVRQIARLAAEIDILMGAS